MAGRQPYLAIAALLLAPAAHAALPPVLTSPLSQAFTQDLEARLASAAPGTPVSVIIHGRVQADLGVLQRDAPPGRTGHAQVTASLHDVYDATMAASEASLARLGATRIVALWSINSIAATLPARAVEMLRRDPAVALVTQDRAFSLVHLAYSPLAPSGWNIAAMHAPDLWDAGYSGQGSVVGVLDTGADPHHPDLATRWRAGAGGWFDPYGEHASGPYDAIGHGTSVTSLAVGGSSSGAFIGAAPGAQWIAARVFNDNGQALVSAVHQAFQFMLDPDGNPATADYPQVVNASWIVAGTLGACDQEFAPDIAALQASGIAAVFAAGNDGPAAGTSDSPANNPGALAIGAFDQTMSVPGFSSRGPSACDGSIFPAIAAPGVSVTAADLTYGGVFPNSYVTVSGTTVAAAQVSGAIAVLAGAFPAARAADIEAALTASAAKLGATSPNNDSGAGAIDMMAAYRTLLQSFTPSAPAPHSSTALVSANYHTVKKTLVIRATNALGAAAGLQLAGAGSMTWHKKTGIWSATLQAASEPSSFTISAADGTRVFRLVPP